MKETMGQIIKRLRKERGFTQEELAEQVGVTFQAISKWENDTGLPDISQVIPLATVFDVSTDVLFGRHGVNDSNEVLSLIHQARSLVDDLTTMESLRRCYDMLHDGLKTYPSNTALLMQCLETGIALAYPENDCYDAQRGKEIYKNCIREAELVIKYGHNATDILRAHMIMVMLHAAYGNTETAKAHAEQFPWRADMTLFEMYAYIAHFEQDYQAEAKHLQTAVFYYTEAIINSSVALGCCYEAQGNIEDAIIVFEKILAPLKAIEYAENPRPHFHYRERGDLYALLAKLYLKTGNTDKALDLLKSMVDFDVSVAGSYQPGTRLKHPLLRDVDYDFFWLPKDVGVCLRQKLSDPAFEPLHDHPRFTQLLAKANSI